MLVTMQIYLLQLFNRFRRNEDGAALAEYGLLVALIAVVCVVAVTALGSQVNIAFSTIASQLKAAIARRLDIRPLCGRVRLRAHDHKSDFARYTASLCSKAAPNFGDTPMYNLVKRFRRDQEGAALAEYGLLIALIAVVCVVAITALGSQVNIAFSTIASQLQAALPAAP